MSLVSAHGVAKSYGPKQVLDGVSVTIEPGDRLGLIGQNGAGKSTLIRILLGREEPDHGEILRKRGLVATAVEQSPRLPLELSVREAVHQGLAANLELRRQLERTSHQLAALPPGPAQDALLAEHEALAHALEQAGGYGVEHQADAVMQALGVPPLDRPLAALSQGELRRVALCAALLAQPELLVLDEPTNHIDVDAIEWLEDRLARYPGALLLVTHDRYFLERVATRMAELDRGELRLYDGSYSEYLAARAEREALEAKLEHRRQRAIESELSWVRRRAPARTTKQQARLQRFDALVAARPKQRSELQSFRLPYPPRLGKTVLEISGLNKALGGRVLVQDLDLLLKKGDRLEVVGPNGAGKTTLLRMVTGELAPDSGRIQLGQNTVVTYADQRRPLDESKTVLEEVAGEGDVVYVGEEAVPVYGFLEGLLFDSGMQRTLVSALSGGEKSRVALAKSLRVAANLLILDEPTNDLDLATLRVLEDALVEFPGCALIVSHDRAFLDRVTTGVLAFEGEGRVVLYEGGYDAFRAGGGGRWRTTEVKAEPPRPRTLEVKAPAKKKLSYKEQQELAAMEARILEAEAKQRALEGELLDPEASKRLGPRMKELLSALEEAKHAVEALYARWEELESR